MKVVTVARKPMASTAAQCAAEWGTGSLNIGASRIDYLSLADQASAIPQGRATAKTGALAGQSQNDRNRSEFVADNTKGRWPANLILQHQPACEVVGEREVKTGVAVRENSGGKTIFSETEKPPLENMSYGEGGKESVPDWRCGEGCPVPDLDAQSGTSTSKAHTRNNAGSWKVRKKGNTTANVDTSHSDTGGASRFFKQVKP